MSTLSECVSTQMRWELAIQTISPARLARTFAAELGQFYDRGEFDALARRVRDLYAVRDPEQGETFRYRLDRRLYDRYHAPVAWDVSSRHQPANASPSAPRPADRRRALIPSDGQSPPAGAASAAWSDARDP